MGLFLFRDVVGLAAGAFVGGRLVVDAVAAVRAGRRGHVVLEGADAENSHEHDERRCKQYENHGDVHKPRVLGLLPNKCWKILRITQRPNG